MSRRGRGREKGKRSGADKSDDGCRCIYTRVGKKRRGLITSFYKDVKLFKEFFICEIDSLFIVFKKKCDLLLRIFRSFVFRSWYLENVIPKCSF